MSSHTRTQRELKSKLVSYDDDKTKFVDFLRNYQDKETLHYKYMDAIVLTSSFICLYYLFFSIGESSK